VLNSTLKRTAGFRVARLPAAVIAIWGAGFGGASGSAERPAVPS